MATGRWSPTGCDPGSHRAQRVEEGKKEREKDGREDEVELGWLKGREDVKQLRTK
jgi:hypothetical protein